MKKNNIFIKTFLFFVVAYSLPSSVNATIRKDLEIIHDVSAIISCLGIVVEESTGFATDTIFLPAYLVTGFVRAALENEAEKLLKDSIIDLAHIVITELSGKVLIRASDFVFYETEAMQPPTPQKTALIIFASLVIKRILTAVLLERLKKNKLSEAGFVYRSNRMNAKIFVTFMQGAIEALLYNACHAEKVPFFHFMTTFLARCPEIVVHEVLGGLIEQGIKEEATVLQKALPEEKKELESVIVDKPEEQVLDAPAEDALAA